MVALTVVESKHSLAKSFEFAFNGVKIAILKGRNFRLQILLGVFAILLGFIFKLESFEWLGLTLVISLVLILELLNTAMESVVDMVSPEIRDKAKIAKDVSAAAVLIASIASIVIALLLFLPKIKV